jgi:5,10-methylenetetrahydrofolate reductase
MSTLLQQLAGNAPALWVEVSPPRGINFEPLLKRLSGLRNKVDALNLTDNAMAKVKLSGLVFAIIIKQRLGIPVALNFSCRDRNLLALKSDLLGAAAMGIDAVVALTGDKVAPLKALPSLIAGAVANPNRGDQERELELLARKATAGARFIITQPVFDLERAERFLDQAAAMGLQVVMGILPVKRAEMANYLKQKVTDLSEVGEHFDRYAGLSEEQSRRLSIEHSLELMNSLASRVAGFNIMSGGGPSLAIELALEFDRQRSRRQA